jgi:hypothetical protein
LTEIMYLDLWQTLFNARMHILYEELF